MRCCLVVTTFERPDALARVLASVATQTRPPDQLVVADDGSGSTTRQVVERFTADWPRPVQHVWQPHEGFRAGRARNLAIACSDCDFVVLLDGDMVLHPDFCADHVRAARVGHWQQGVRVRLDARATRRLLDGGDLPTAASAGLGLRRRAYALRSGLLARVSGRVGNAFIAVKACNQGFWRRDLLAVNGFDEAMAGWGAEDKELCARLSNAGIRRRTLLFSAIAYHLEHAAAARDAAGANRQRWLDTVRTGRTRCAVGIDQHLRR